MVTSSTKRKSNTGSFHLFGNGVPTIRRLHSFLEPYRILDMDALKTGTIIKERRKELGYTQKVLAELLFLEPKTISKWETGKGFPDISHIAKLSEILGIEATKIIEGEIKKKTKDSGNLKRMSFYLCPECNNLLWSTSSASIFCCAERLSPLVPAEEKIDAEISLIDGSYYITTKHEMTKENYILFIALQKDDTLTLKRLYPEGESAATFARTIRGNLYIGTSKGELFSFKIQDKKDGLYLI